MLPNVLLTAAIRPLSASHFLRAVWNHSLQVAVLAERLARIPGRVQPSEAFLAGLVHDIDRMFVDCFPAAMKARYQRLIEGGCPATQVETVLTVTAHAKVGTQFLERWNFHSAICNAVSDHHFLVFGAPLASILYLAESQSEIAEDLPSVLRLHKL